MVGMRRAVLRCTCSSAREPHGFQKNKSVFTLHAKIHVSMHEVLQAYEMCRHIPSAAARLDTYALFGLDGMAVEAYIDTVMMLDRMLQNTPKI